MACPRSNTYNLEISKYRHRGLNLITIGSHLHVDIDAVPYSDQRLKKALDKVIPPDPKYQTHRTDGCGELVAYHVWPRLMYGSGNGLKVLTWGEINDKRNNKTKCQVRPLGVKPFELPNGSATIFFHRKSRELVYS